MRTRKGKGTGGGETSVVERESPVSDSKAPVSGRVAAAIVELDDALRDEFDPDFAYTVRGRGKVLAASNANEGLVTPVVNGTDKRVFTVEELRLLPVGTKLVHAAHGAGEVVELEGDRTGVRFGGGLTFAFNRDGPPWDEKVTIVRRVN